MSRSAAFLRISDLVLVGGAVVLLASCGSSPAPISLEAPEGKFPQRIVAQTPSGESVTFDVLQARNDEGILQYRLRHPAQGTFVVNIAAYEQGESAAVELSDGSTLAQLLRQNDGSVALVNHAGRSLFSHGGGLSLDCVDSDMFDPFALALLSDEALAQMRAEPQGHELAQGLRISNFGAGCGVTCSSDNGDQTCCCAVGERCTKGITFCRCEDAHGVYGISSFNFIY